MREKVITHHPSRFTFHVSRMTSWRPHSSPVRFLYLLLPLLSIVVAGWLWAQIGQVLLNLRQAQEQGVAQSYDGKVFLIGLALFLALVLAGISAYLAWCAFTISYRLDRSSLRIRCGGVTHIVPFESIKGVFGAGIGAGVAAGKAIDVAWDVATPALPGYVVGT